ncbi:putative 3-demethylubiquinone-9 3-methyltransferase (glyoxalase superfamily) [Salirhabdus euzebyi]|uniref:Putative 3-demethylubiquinone-9 3-methyltransferase (Glyoxalase superfamily) n=1 Tax=Salirhabdus euzebyi TaxID=394506 RepID=A0A841Q456_9BACI|nr:VOC family protein [Salirhabdus euzebyi]MBB6453178.1 putative 3-demethylubiquinone-9 3-methyltransferase (glyoxalase superfamily) [Salirhabdus euzebyi]
MQKIHAFFMFEGNAEEAMEFYTSLFYNSEIRSISRYGKNEAGEEGKVENAIFTLKGQEFMCTDSVVNHEFSFTPSISFYVTCDHEEEINGAFEQLSEHGKILMPLATYPFSKKFGWLEDRFGVSWQLTLPH